MRQLRMEEEARMQDEEALRAFASSEDTLESIEDDMIAAVTRGRDSDWPPKWAPVPVAAATLWWCSQW